MSEHLCTCGTVMFYDQENDQHVCFPCAHKEAVRLHEVEVARDAIVDAADKQESAFEGDKSDADYANTCRVTEERVRAWRKLKGM